MRQALVEGTTAQSIRPLLPCAVIWFASGGLFVAEDRFAPCWVISYALVVAKARRGVRCLPPVQYSKAPSW